MNYGLMRERAKQRAAEDARDVDFIIENFKNDNYTDERLNKALIEAERYERESGGSRANRNVIKAIKQLLSERELKF